jgi:hypothetical protein
MFFGLQWNISRLRWEQAGNTKVIREAYLVPKAGMLKYRTCSEKEQVGMHDEFRADAASDRRQCGTNATACFEGSFSGSGSYLVMPNEQVCERK